MQTESRNGTKRGHMRRGSALGDIGAVAAALVLATPQAGAAASAINVEQGLSFGAKNYGTGCTYKVTATADPAVPDPVIFGDEKGGTFSATSVPLTGNTASTNWTPRNTGMQYVGAYQNTLPAQLQTVDVNTGFPIFGMCVVLPW